MFLTQQNTTEICGNTVGMLLMEVIAEVFIRKK